MDISTRKIKNMRTRFFNQLIVMVVLLGLLWLEGCKDSGKVYRPTIIGKAGEMLVVMDDSIKQSVGGKTLMQVLKQPVVGLPQGEPLFDLSVIPHRAFTERLRPFRNLILVKLGSQEEPSVKFYSKQWAKQQAMAHIYAKNSWQMDSLVKAEEIRLAGYFIRAERDRSQEYYRKYINKELTLMIGEKWDASMIVPTNFRRNKPGKDFSWISHETPLISQGIYIYSFDYTGPECIEKEYLLNKRDSVLQINVPGSAPGSYVTTETSLPVTYKHFEHNDHQIVELRGLWKMEGDLMGGPFVSFAHIDEVNSRVVVTEGYVFAPEKPEKRNLVWQLESILYSFSFKPWGEAVE